MRKKPALWQKAKSYRGQRSAPWRPMALCGSTASLTVCSLCLTCRSQPADTAVLHVSLQTSSCQQRPSIEFWQSSTGCRPGLFSGFCCQICCLRLWCISRSAPKRLEQGISCPAQRSCKQLSKVATAHAQRSTCAATGTQPPPADTGNFYSRAARIATRCTSTAQALAQFVPDVAAWTAFCCSAARRICHGMRSCTFPGTTKP